MNDNPPTFDRPTYQTTIVEGDEKNLPKKILQVNIDILTIERLSDRPLTTSYFATFRSIPHFS